ncbi:unnamed protein product [Bursaphelenchus xylophilus]|uniref:(pine wood nematode) hypothetical protein n=1 Tax=Bursaphelenchus xylophilus TaxID=6326 RepID=A0A1I7RKU7_BURXY|nr:unnamed protein product [Bursaphelenchus xylophilus]CAG9083871.1 unnamed protein product [Bursaphelenchus xylophilus]
MNSNAYRARNVANARMGRFSETWGISSRFDVRRMPNNQNDSICSGKAPCMFANVERRNNRRASAGSVVLWQYKFGVPTGPSVGSEGKNDLRPGMGPISSRLRNGGLLAESDSNGLFFQLEACIIRHKISRKVIAALRVGPIALRPEPKF